MRYIVPFCLIALAGCTGTFPGVQTTAPVTETVDPVIDPETPMSTSPQASTTAMSPQARPADLKIAEPFVEEVQTAELPPPPKPEVKPTSFGTTVATLGDPTQPGIWIKTPLISKRQKGRIVAANGKEVVADFIPLDGPATAGSRMSLPAMQALGLALTDLHTVALNPL